MFHAKKIHTKSQENEMLNPTPQRDQIKEKEFDWMISIYYF
jgi:hypothetical protein